MKIKFRNKTIINLVILIFAFTSFLFLSCNKKEKKVDRFKAIEYKINTILYNKKYKDAIKYIDSVYFTEKESISSKQKEILQFRQAEIKYLYLNKDLEAYKEMKKIFKNKKLDSNNYVKLLSYLTTISEKIDYQNLGIFIEELIQLKKEKPALYKYINFLKKEKNSKKLQKLINENTLLSKDELILLNLDLLLMQKDNKNKILEFIKSSISKTKNQTVIDKLNVEKIFYLEQQENVNYKELLEILKLIKSKNYNNFKINKEKFYKNKISLYNKK